MNILYFTMMRQITVLFLLIAIGFFLRRKKILPDSTARVLSILETHIFLPALALKNLSANFRREMLGENLFLILVGILFLLLILVIGYLLTNFYGRKTSLAKNILFYIFTFPNYGYFGYPVIDAIFGEKMLTLTMILAIPVSISIYSLGICVVNGSWHDKSGRTGCELPGFRQEKESMSLSAAVRLFPGRLKAVFSPVLGGLAIGILLGITQFPVPKPVYEGVSMLSSCMGPVAMLLTGFVLAAYPLGRLFVSIQSYIISFIRLLVIPFFVGLVLWMVGMRNESLMIPVIISAMPVGLNIIIFPEAVGKDTSEYARICFASYLMSILTIPLVFMIIIYIAGCRGLAGF